MDWLALDKHVWRRIFHILNAGPLTHCWYDVCSLRAVCKFMRDVSLLRINGLRWVFRSNPSTASLVRRFIETPIREWPKHTAREDIEWKEYIKKRRPVFSKKAKPTPQPLESISWCEPNEKTKERGSRRSHHQKKSKSRGDFRRSGAMDEPYQPGGYICWFSNPSEVYPWAEIECVITEIKDSRGAVKGKYISERLWKDPVTNVIYYRQKY